MSGGVLILPFVFVVDANPSSLLQLLILPFLFVEDANPPLVCCSCLPFPRCLF